MKQKYNKTLYSNQLTKLDLEFEEKGDLIDMCQAMEDNNKKKEVTGAIKMLRSDGASDEDIITKVIKLFGVTKDYVLALLTPQKV